MIQELHAGDRQIPASGWNEMRAAVQGITPGQQQYQSAARNPVYITIKNVTGSDLPAFSVVKLSGATYSRTGDTFINQAIANGVELNGDTPASATDTIAITQAACAAGEFVRAIVSGASPAMILNDSIYAYTYARVKAGVTSYLEPTNDKTAIRLITCPTATGSSTPQGAYAIIDYIDDRQTFTVPASLASTAKKGAVFKIYLSSTGWQIRTGVGAYILAVCQEDMDDNATEPMQMPFYTPEQNYGVSPDMGTPYQADALVQHRGVIDGEYEFSTKRLDYVYQYGRYAYCPTFTFTGTSVSYNGGVGIVIEGHTYSVTFLTGATPGAGYSLTSYPDVYAGDIITVLVTDGGGSAYSANVTAVEYPTDFKKGTSIVVEDTMLLERGWDEDYIPNTNYKYAIKIQGNSLT